MDQGSSLLPERYQPGGPVSIALEDEGAKRTAITEIVGDKGREIISSLLAAGLSADEVAARLHLSKRDLARAFSEGDSDIVQYIEGQMANLAIMAGEKIQIILGQRFFTVDDARVVKSLNSLVDSFARRQLNRDNARKGIAKGVVVNNVIVARTEGSRPDLPPELEGLVEEAEWKEL